MDRSLPLLLLLLLLVWSCCFIDLVSCQNGRLEQLVKTENIFVHLNEFQRIADRPENKGSRAINYGYNQSVDYVVEQLETHTDLVVSVQLFPATISQYTEEPILELLEPTYAKFEINTEFLGYNQGGKGDIEAGIQSIRDGCNIQDFTKFISGKIALLNRITYFPPDVNATTCSYRVKITNAVQAGAVGVLMYDPNDMLPTLGGADFVEAPVFGIASNLANYFNELTSSGEQVIIRMVSDCSAVTLNTFNVFAETKTGRSDRVVLIGSHLDSVPAGPGINDNGSGSATLLATALEIGKLETLVNKVRFAWWGAEEWGLLGAQYYVDNLSDVEKNRISLNLNFDMIGSPNYIRGIYNGREAEEEIREGCTAIQELFEKHFEKKGLASESTPFTGRSDYGPFLEAKIPAGGLFSGAEEKKTFEQRDKFGGSANVALDSCYHLLCDSVSNISEDSITELGAAAVSVLETFAFMEDINEFLSRNK